MYFFLHVSSARLTLVVRSGNDNDLYSVHVFRKILVTNLQSLFSSSFLCVKPFFYMK